MPGQLTCKHEYGRGVEDEIRIEFFQAQKMITKYGVKKGVNIEWIVVYVFISVLGRLNC
jgi:hypothetical protein